MSLDYACVHSEQEKDEDKRMPIIVMKDNKTMMMMMMMMMMMTIAMAKVVPNKGVHEHAVEVVGRFVQQ